MSGTTVVGETVAQLDWMTRSWMPRAVQRSLLWIQPDGGQRRARRNAWSSMVVDTQRRAQRLEVERSVALAAATSPAPLSRRIVSA